jgi:hypothetical protein
METYSKERIFERSGNMAKQSGFTDTFEQFLGKLGERVEQAKSAGMSTADIQRNAERMGDWLAQSYTPETPEERVLRELWEVSDQREQQAMANAMVRLVQRQH